MMKRLDRDPNRVCLTCVHWSRHGATELGACRHAPPGRPTRHLEVPVADGLTVVCDDRWPLAYAAEWCGAYTADA